MATPGMSRSGRVLKKSVKLLEMETDYKPAPVRLSLLKTPKSETTGVESVLLKTPTTIGVSVPVIKLDAATPTSSTTMTATNTGNLKIKFNLANDAITKVEPKEAIQPTSGTVKMNLNPAAIASATKLTTPFKIVASNKTAISPNAIVLKLKSDSIVNPNAKILTATPKRALEVTPSSTPEATKKIKVELQPEQQQSKPAVVATAIVATPTMVSATSKPTIIHSEFPKKIVVQQQKQPQVFIKSEPEKKFTAIMSPIVTTADVKPKILQSFATSTPKINTVAPPKPIIARSIQETKRINQRTKANQSVSTPKQTTPPPSRASTSTRRAASVKVTDGSDQAEDPKNEKKKHAVSAYVLWCRESRREMQSRYPDLDFINLSRKMGEIWHTLAQNEKDIWFKKARLLTASSVATDELYSQGWISDDLKPRIVSSKQTLPITTETLNMYDENFAHNEQIGIIGTEAHPVGTELIDVQAYLNILGDSLETIGSYLQRGVKYNSEIDYSKSTALSTLLDTALVAMGSLTCLTRAIPKIAPSKEKMAKTLEDVTYFMPPSDLSYSA